MKLCILQTGSPPGDLATRFPSYADMIMSALGEGFDYRVFDVQRGQLPVGDEGDGFVVSGSPSGVHDGDPWIADLRGWLQEVDPGRPLVGICFGHQIMAEAYGGRVERAAQGWGLGFHRYAVAAAQPWMCERPSFSIPAAHQDQVVQAPPDTVVVAKSPFCPVAALAYRSRRAISFQGHPEFTAAYADAVVDRRERAGSLSAHRAQVARRSIRRGGDDRSVVLDWTRRFLRHEVAPS